MSATYDLFRRWMAAKGHTSERQGAKALGLSPAAVTPWKNGRNGSLAIIKRLAKDLGEDYVTTALKAWEETEPRADEKRLLRELTKRLGAPALLAFAGWLSAPEAAHAAAQESTQAIHYANRKRRRSASRTARTSSAHPEIGGAAAQGGSVTSAPFRRSPRHHEPSPLRPRRRRSQPLRPVALRVAG